jgi:hypothetical protein
VYTASDVRDAIERGTHCPMYTALCTLHYTLHYVHCTTHCTMYTALHTALCTLHYTLAALYTLHYGHALHYTLHPYNIHIFVTKGLVDLFLLAEADVHVGSYYR